MSSSHLLDYEQIDLIEGLLGATGREQALEHLEECAGCEAHFRRLAAQREWARVSIPPMSLAPRKTWRTPALRYILPFAAAALLAWLWLRPEGSTPQNLPTLPPPGTELLHRNVDAPEGWFRAGLDAYARGDYQRAASELEREHSANDEGWELQRRVYLGSALARLGRYREAIVELESLDFDVLPDPWREQTLITFGVSLCLAGHSAGLESLLDRIADESLALEQSLRREIDCQ